MKGILWYVTRKLEGIFDGILMEFHMRISEDKNQIKKSMYTPRFLSSGLYGSATTGLESRVEPDGPSTHPAPLQLYANLLKYRIQ